MPGQPPSPPNTVDTAAGNTAEADAKGKIPVLYVAGMARSGSTLLDLMLGQLVDHVEIGELFYLWMSQELNLRCACGEPFHQCPFWIQVGEKAYGGWSAVDPVEIQRLQKRVDTTSKLPLIKNPDLSPKFRQELERYVELLTPLYRAILDVSGAKVVVDSSKRPSLAYILARVPEIDIRMAHILRDPRGVAYSWSKPVPLPEGTSKKGAMEQRSTYLSSRRWVTVNMMISTLAKRGVPRTVLRYEDLVADPRRELSRIAAMTADVTGIEDPLDFIRGNEVDQHGSHAAAGGRIRMLNGPITVKLDEKWRREYSPSRQRAVAAMTWPLRRKYGY